jgi:hypothetical protein
MAAISHARRYRIVNLNRRWMSVAVRHADRSIQATSSARRSTIRTKSDMMRFNSKSLGV